MEEIIIYASIDVNFSNPRNTRPCIVAEVAVNNTKEGRALFQPYKEKNNWGGMEIRKFKMSLEEFNKLENKPTLIQ